MTQRYSLRFDSGERHGESVPIVGESFTVGRRPGNSLQIVENSVSGRHAELEVQGERVLLRDLGSTNGTHVDDQRVQEAELSHGACILFGSVRMQFADSSIAGEGAQAAARGSGVPVRSAPAATPGSVPAAKPATRSTAGATAGAPGPAAATATPGQDATAGGGPERVSDEMLRKSRGSKSGLLILTLALAAGGGGAWWFLGPGGSAGGGAPSLPVEPVEGNLLADSYSFEGEAGGWETPEGSPEAFIGDASARVSGDSGVSAQMGAQQFALHASKVVPAVRDGRMQAGAEMRAVDARARLGLEFSDSKDGGATPMRVWSGSIEGDEVQAVRVESLVPRGYDRCRVLLYGGSEVDGGVALADDVWLVGESGGGATAKIGEYRFYAMGSPATAGSLFKIDRIMLSGLRFLGSGEGVADGGIRGLQAFEAAAEPKGIRLRSQGAGRFLFRVQGETYAAGIATMGAGGYQRHSSDFEREGAQAVLVASGMDLLRIGFDEPAKVRGRVADGGLEVTVELTSGSVLVQTDFESERIEAAKIAGRADNAEREERYGDCLAAWRELVDLHPYEHELLQRANSVTSRLLREGLAKHELLEAKVERARFFRLADLYAECAEEARALGQRYAGSEIEERVRELVVSITAERSALIQDLDKYEKQRLSAILSVLEAQGSKELASQVRSYLEEHFGVER